MSLILRKKDRVTFTGKDIDDATADFDVLNPDLVIATLADDVELEMELRIGRGRGYVPAEEMASDFEDDVNLMPIDAIFTPIKSVQFDVENVRVGQRTDYEKLVLNVTTDGFTECQRSSHYFRQDSQRAY